MYIKTVAVWAQACPREERWHLMFPGFHPRWRSPTDPRKAWGFLLATANTRCPHQDVLQPGVLHQEVHLRSTRRRCTTRRPRRRMRRSQRKHRGAKDPRWRRVRRRAVLETTGRPFNEGESGREETLRLVEGAAIEWPTGHLHDDLVPIFMLHHRLVLEILHILHHRFGCRARVDPRWRSVGRRTRAGGHAV